MQKAPAQFRFAAVAVDIPVFAILDGMLHALVSPVNRPPHYVNQLGFLGAMVTAAETTDQAATRVLAEKGGLNNPYLEQLYTFSDIARDKRNRVVAVAYLGLVKPDHARSHTHEEATFVPVSELKHLAYDHDEILQVALTRLRDKLSYTTIAQFLLPHHFTLTQLQQVYEIIQRKTYDKRNFRKKILALGIVRDTGTTEDGVTHRPAALYEFTSKKLVELPLIT